MTRRSIFFGLLFAIGLFVIARVEYYPQSGMFSAMGMSGPRANSGRRCFGITIWHLLRGQVPPTEICVGPSVFIPPTISHNENVAVDPVTHRLKHAQTIWSLDDSVQWASKRDSILVALARFGGHPVACNTPPAFRRFADAFYWKFPDFYLKVRADKTVRDFDGQPVWLVGIEGFPQMPFECINRP